MSRLIYADKLEKTLYAIVDEYQSEHIFIDAIIDAIGNAPAIDAVELPCKIGDEVWCIRHFYSTPRPQLGIVSEMYITHDSELCIVVKHVGRGEWGTKVFATYEDAQAAIERRNGT